MLSQTGATIFATSSTEKMRISGTGNVSIGNTNNTYKLEVTGTTNITGQLTLGSTITNGTYTYTLPGATGTLALTSALSGYLPLTGGTLTGALSGTSATFNGNLTIQGGNEQQFYRSDNAIYTRLYDGGGVNGFVIDNRNGDGFNLQATGTSQMRISAAGNVAIGTATTTSIGSYKTLTIQGGNTSNGGLIQIQNSDSTCKAYWFNTNNSSTLKTVTNHQLIFGANNTDYLYLNSSGNLALGTTSSAWGLGKAIEIGNIGNAIWGVSATQYNIIQNAYFDSGYKYASSNAASYYQQTSGSHVWWNAPSGTANAVITFTQAMTLNASGNLGLGITAPTGKLQVVADGAGNLNTNITGSQLILSRSTGASENLAFRNTGTSTGISGLAFAAQIISSGNNVLEMFTNGAQPLVLGTNATERARITSAGNIGVGTTTPTDYTTFGYGPVIETRGGVGGVFITKNSTGTLLGSFSADSGSSLIKLKAETNHALAFFTNDLEKARITTSGNFNIKNGTITTGASFSITALNTNTVINSTPYSGLIVIRDNTNGGSAVWLADPNMGYIQISNNMPGTFSMSYGSGVTNIQKNSGSVPVNYSVGFYSNVLA
jgi:hypothetical protein